MLAQRGVDFSLLGAIGGPDNLLVPFLEELAATKFVRDRAVFLPFIAPWRVPGLLDACSLLCSLERRFDVDAHVSRVPVEALKRGAPLFLSSEMADKLPFRDSLVDGANCVIIQDPAHLPELTEQLETYLLDPEKLATIGQAGGSLAARFRAVDDAPASAIEQALMEVRSSL